MLVLRAQQVDLSLIMDEPALVRDSAIRILFRHPAHRCGEDPLELRPELGVAQEHAAGPSVFPYFLVGFIYVVRCGSVRPATPALGDLASTRSHARRRHVTHESQQVRVDQAV